MRTWEETISVSPNLAPTRQRAIMARPVIVDPAFEDPDAVIALVRSGGPYGLLYSAEGYARAGGAEPWFRGNRGQWIKGPNDRRVPEAEPFFNNPRFIEAAMQSFGAALVRPESMKLNLNGPMGPGVQHRDVCRFRGATHADFPHWVVVAMHHSELFDAWSTLVASALTWFYRGAGGGLEYWPEGPRRPSHRMTPPLWNVAMVCDNEYIFHRVEGIGVERDWVRPGVMSGREELSWSSDGCWEMREGGVVLQRFAPEVMRLSILWKAYVFRDEAEQAAFDEHTDDLTLDIILDVFADDLRARGIDMPKSARPLADRALRDLLLTTYPPAAERYFPEAHREPMT
jgi:hypothetical protein